MVCRYKQTKAFTEKNKKHYEIINVPNTFQITHFSKEESNFQVLWKTFFNTISIKERQNARLQMQFMPKKYWQDLVEMR